MPNLNPLLALSHDCGLAELDAHERLRARNALMTLRVQCAERAQAAWRNHDGRMAVYWRALATYCLHASRCLGRVPRAAGRSVMNPADAANFGEAGMRRCAPAMPAAGLHGFALVMRLSSDCRRALSRLAGKLSCAARELACVSWKRSKAPMADYWRDVARHARHFQARLWRMPRAQTDRVAPPGVAAGSTPWTEARRAEKALVV